MTNTKTKTKAQPKEKRATPKPKTPTFRNRIKEYLPSVRVGDLAANPENWREHPESQNRALDYMLRRIGFAGALIAFKKKGKLTLIDGHLRKELVRDPDDTVPVLVLDVNEAEAKEILLTFDPLTALASAGMENLQALMDDIDLPQDDISEMLAQLEVEATAFTGGDSSFDSTFDEDGNVLDDMVDEDGMGDGLNAPCPTCDSMVPRKKLAKLLGARRDARKAKKEAEAA